MPTIGLCMIVKDEARVITRCLDSVRPLIDYVLVEDTGSTDGTQQLVAAWLAREGLPGEVISEPWRDFAYNRTHALAKMREVQAVDYVLMIDADDAVVFADGFDPAAFKAGLTHDAYQVVVHNGPFRWLRPHMGSNRITFTFQGVLHECLTTDVAALSMSEITGFHIDSGGGGARNRNPEKYRDDAAMLEKVLQAETDPRMIARYTFYLAQSYRDAGDQEKARETYLKRAELGDWPEEVFCSLYEAARLDEAMGRPVDETVASYMRAAAAGQARAEPHFGAARCCFYAGRFEEAYEHALAGVARPMPAAALFVRPEIYGHRLLHLLALAALDTGRWSVCIAACDRLLTEGRLPAEDHDSVRNTRGRALSKLHEAEAESPSHSRFLQLLEAARAMETVCEAPAKVLAAYELAAAAAPRRAEAFHGAARVCRAAGRYDDGCAFARRGLARARPAGAPGLEGWIYDYGLLDELMANAFWAGRYAESAEACDRMMRERLMPPDMQERVARNREVLRAKLQAPASVN